jgi:hypothetical protein
LLPGSAAQVSVSVNATANSLPVGNYTNGMLILDVTDGFARYCKFTLQVQQAIVQNGGFETGNFSGWTESGNTTQSSVAVSKGSNYAYSSQYGAELGPAGSLGYLSQTVPTSAGQPYLLSLWLDSPDGKTPNQFLVAWNGTTLFNQTNLAKIGWTNLQFIVTAAGSSSVLQFGFRDDPSYLGLDDISLAPIPTPNFQYAIQAGDAISLSWSASAGLKYQVQYATNLAQAQWFNLGNAAVCTNATAVLSTSIGPDQTRFYRVLLLP